MRTKCKNDIMKQKKSLNERERERERDYLKFFLQEPPHFVCWDLATTFYDTEYFELQMFPCYHHGRSHDPFHQIE
jgi:hypothetical protein